MRFTHAGKRLQELLSWFGMHARCGNYSDPEDLLKEVSGVTYISLLSASSCGLHVK